LLQARDLLQGEKISLYLDTILVSDPNASIIIGNDYRFYGVAHIPNIADMTYHLIAESESHSRAHWQRSCKDQPVSFHLNSKI